MNRLLFTDVILPERNLEERWDVTVEGGQIVSILSQGSGDLSSAEAIEGKGRWLLPGFIDDHVNQALGQLHLPGYDPLGDSEQPPPDDEP